MGASVSGIHLSGIHSARPAGNAVPDGSLYSCTTHGLIYKSDFVGNSWATWATLGGSPSGSITASGYTQATGKLLGRTTASTGAIEELTAGAGLSLSGGSLSATGLQDQGVITYLDATGASAPSTPASGKARIYAKTDGRIYSKNDAGVEYGPFDVAGGGGAASPLLYFDTLSHGSKYDDFSGGTGLSGWTFLNSMSSSDLAAITSETYDGHCLDCTFTAAGKGFYKSWTGDGTIYLSIHGAKNNAGSGLTPLGGMMGLFFTDSSGNGIGCSLYDDGAFYQWIITGHTYSGTGNAASISAHFPTPTATTWPIIYSLTKTGTSYQAGLSLNGGVTYIQPAAQTIAGTTARAGVARHFASGGTNPVLRIGTFNNA